MAEITSAKAMASATLLPRMLSRTRRDLRGETRTVRAIALAEVISAIVSSSY